MRTTPTRRSRSRERISLHPADVERLLGLLDRLVDSGKSVVVEHHQAVMARADRIVDLGPGAGHDLVMHTTPFTS